MIGYSDSSKDAGKICASWHQYKAQEEIVKLAKKFKIDVTFFHGRGGSAGRGGGPIQATLKSQPPYSVNGKIRITDQGEVIQQKYGYEPLAKYNLCSYIGAVTEATLNPPPAPKKNWRDLIEKMSEISKNSYRKNINQIFLKTFFKSSKFVTSQTNDELEPLVLFIILLTLSKSDLVLLIITTFAPASASAIAQAFPNPFPAPVTRAVLFFRSIFLNIKRIRFLYQYILIQ